MLFLCQKNNLKIIGKIFGDVIFFSYLCIKLENMGKVVVHEFDPVIYPYKLWVVVSRDLDNACEMFYDLDTNKPFVFKTKDKYAAMALPSIKVEGRYYGTLIVFESKKQMSVKNIAHESSHAAKQLFEHIGADIKEHEPFEYVVGWIAECCEKVLKNKD